MQCALSCSKVRFTYTGPDARIPILSRPSDATSSGDAALSATTRSASSSDIGEAAEFAIIEAWNSSQEGSVELAGPLAAIMVGERKGGTTCDTGDDTSS